MLACQPAEHWCSAIEVGLELRLPKLLHLLEEQLTQEAKVLQLSERLLIHQAQASLFPQE
jgi:hypothetical protein